MKIPATVPVRFNETVEVEVDIDNDIRLAVDYKHVYLDAKQARRVAKALKKAAKVAERNAR